MLKLTIGEIVHAGMAIESLLKNSTRMSFHTAYTLLKVKRELDIVEGYVAERIGVTVGLGGDGTDALMEGIYSSEVEIDVDHLKINDFSNDSGLTVSLDELNALMPLLR